MVIKKKMKVSLEMFLWLKLLKALDPILSDTPPPICFKPAKTGPSHRCSASSCSSRRRASSPSSSRSSTRSWPSRRARPRSSMTPSSPTSTSLPGARQADAGAVHPIPALLGRILSQLRFVQAQTRFQLPVSESWRVRRLMTLPPHLVPSL